jgi:hypothetical protein
MKKVAAFLVVVAGSLLLGNGTTAQEKDKEVKLKGKVTCAKCDLGVADKCATVVVAKKKGKDTVYYFDPAGHKKYHAAICNSAKDGTVTGTVSKKDDKYIIKVKEVKYE